MLFPEAEVTKSLSKNLVKQIYMVMPQDEEKRIIDSNELVRKRLRELYGEDYFGAEGFTSGLPGAEVLEVPAEEVSGNIIKAQTEAKAIVDEAGEEAKAILARAAEDAARIRSEAKTQAETERQQVLSQARQQGYQEGREQAQTEAKARVDAAEREYLEKARSMEEEYQRQIDVLEPEFINVITAVYEHFFNVETSGCKDVLAFLISNAIHNLEGSRSFTIRVSRDDYSYVTMQKNQILAGAVSGSCNVDVVEDMSLGKNECMIETDGGIFDCGLDTQLSELKRRLQLLSWDSSRLS